MPVPEILLVGAPRLGFPGRFGPSKSAAIPLWPEAAAGAPAPAQRESR